MIDHQTGEHDVAALAHRVRLGAAEEAKRKARRKAQRQARRHTR